VIDRIVKKVMQMKGQGRCDCARAEAGAFLPRNGIGPTEHWSSAQAGLILDANPD
jgi:hypothetical protein